MAKYSTNLKIADVIIKMQSDFPLQKKFEEDKKIEASERFDNFFYKGSKKPDILINVRIVDKLPDYDGEVVFITKHFQDGSENWRLLKKGNTFIYKSPLEDKKQVVVVNQDLNRVEAYILPKKTSGGTSLKAEEYIKEHKGFVWNTSDLIYDFLQVLLINYLAKYNLGIFTHSVGIKDTNGQGYIFTGKSGAGKSTTARLWYKNTKAMILNDDRVIVRKKKGVFHIYGSPWHGEFSDYLKSRIDDAPIKNIFFIYHAKENKIRRVAGIEAFSNLYPALFPTFWDKESLTNIAAFMHELIETVSCWRLGFINDTRIIDFIRKFKASHKE